MYEDLLVVWERYRKALSVDVPSLMGASFTELMIQRRELLMVRIMVETDMGNAIRSRSLSFEWQEDGSVIVNGCMYFSATSSLDTNPKT